MRWTTKSDADRAAIKAGEQKGWAAGDFSRFATTIVIVSERLCEAVDLRAGQRVLDVATGSGNTAIAAARMDRLGEPDAASQDVLIEVVRELEQQLSMIRAQLPR